MRFDLTDAGEAGSERYLREEGVLDILNTIAAAPGQFPPDIVDLARLHYMVVSRKCFTVLEFGVGWSTVVLAAAMKKNEESWNGLENRPRVRNETPFRVYSVDGSNKWIKNVERMMPDNLAGYVEVKCSDLHVGTFNHRICHYYDEIPDVVADFVYLDAPHHENVSGDVNGLSWKNRDRTIIAGDLLMMESTFLPGTCILVDGRTNNVRFLLNNMQRNWGSIHDVKGDVTVMELQESPLGGINESTLRYCLGEEYFERVQRVGSQARAASSI